MDTVHLKDFAKQRGQPEAAMLLGLTQGALSKAIRIGRNVVVTSEADGTFSAEERKPFPARAETRKKIAWPHTLNANLLEYASCHQTDETAVHASSAPSPCVAGQSV